MPSIAVDAGMPLAQPSKASSSAALLATRRLDVLVLHLHVICNPG
jgi:hypothetical protein